MKKLLLTAFAAAAFSMAAMAQERDTTRNESNEFRRDPNRVDSTEMRDDMESDRVLNESDSLSQDEERESTNYQDNARELRDSLRQDAEEASDELRQDAAETRDSIEQDAERIGDDIESDAESTRDSVNQDAKELGDYLKANSQEAQKDDAGNVIRQGSDQALDTQQAEEDRTRTSAEDQGGKEAASSNSGTSMSSPVPSTPIEVVEDKEGPNNEVVYKFNDEMWYVDRETKQMVKADESQLKDSNHKVIVHDGLAKDDTRKKKKS